MYIKVVRLHGRRAYGEYLSSLRSRKEFVGYKISDNRLNKGLNINTMVSAIVSKASKFEKVSHDLWVIPCQRSLL